MLKFDFLAEEKESKAEKHKKITLTFEKKSSKLFTYIFKWIKSWF